MKVEKVRIGAYQILSLLLLSVNLVIVAMSHALTIFYKYTPKFYCQDSNATETGNRTYGCQTSGCPGGYKFEANFTRIWTERSVAMEWQLICEREYLQRVATEIYYGGSFLGAIVAGFLADRFGRFPVLAICLYAQGTMAVILNFVTKYQLFLVFRGLQGFFIQGLESCTFILCIELFPSRVKTLIAFIILSMRTFGLVLLSGLDYAILDWRMLQLVVSIPTAVTILYIWFLPESPRWLIAKKKWTEAEILFEKIGNYNGFCGLRKNRNDLGEKEQELQEHQLGEKPQKPKRKTLIDSNPSDVEKSPEESENLLTPAEQQSTVNHDGIDKTNLKNVTTELDIEDIDKSSVTTAEAVDEKHDEDNESYSVDEDDALPTNKAIVKKDKKQRNTNSFSQFFESSFIGRTGLILMLLWLVASMTFHILISLPHRLSSERHASLSLAAAMEMMTFAIFFMLISSRCAGRRIPLCFAQILAGIICIVIAALIIAIPINTTDWIVHAKAAIVGTGRITNIGIFFILRILVIELFPTISRGTGVGLCVGAEMLGVLLTPYILTLNNYIPELSRFLIGFLCICVAFLTLMFPDTSQTNLPNSVIDAQKLIYKNVYKNDDHNDEQYNNPEVLKKKLFSEDWIEADNGTIVNFTDDKNSE